MAIAASIGGVCTVLDISGSADGSGSGGGGRGSQPPLALDFFLIFNFNSTIHPTPIHN